MKQLKRLSLGLLFTLIASAICWGFSWLATLGNRVDAIETDKAVKDEIVKSIRDDLDSLKRDQGRTLCLLGEKSRCY